MSGMKELAVALQLYSIRDIASKDFFGSLRQVKSIGYDYVEFTADFHGLSAAAIRRELDRLGLQAVSCHVPLDNLINDLDANLASLSTLGCRYVAVPWLDEPRRPGMPGYPAVVEAMGKIGRACHAAGLTLLYHNHDFDFVKLEGEYALDILYRSVPSDYLQTEIDTCWASVAGVDPAAYIRKYAGRSPIVHLKDYFISGTQTPGRMYSLIGSDGKDEGATGGRGSFDFRPLGMGVMDVPAILEAARDADTGYVVVEQDRSNDRPSLDASRISRDYLRSLGL
jgi:sugar phosphate isomerase/epimerase